MALLPELVTCEHLTLRRWTPDDGPRLRAAIEANVEHLRPWMDWIAFEPLSDSDRRALVVGWDEEWRAAGDAVYGAFLDDTVVGGCGLHRRAGPDTLEIGYWVHMDHVRQGYATEIARALTDTALAHAGVTRVEIHHDIANDASQGVPEALGYRCEGDTPRPVAAPGQVGIDRCWSTTRETWAG